MTRPLVDTDDGLLRRPGGEAEDLAGFRVQPGPLYVEELLGVLAATGLEAASEVLAVGVPDTCSRALSPGPDSTSPAAILAPPRTGSTVPARS